MALQKIKSGSYHQNAQKFINSAKSKGMKVKAEGSKLIAYPKAKMMNAAGKSKNK